MIHYMHRTPSAPCNILFYVCPGGFLSLLLFFFLRFYLFDRERQSARGGTQVGGVGEEEAGSEEPDMGLDPRTPGSHPEPKADA